MLNDKIPINEFEYNFMLANGITKEEIDRNCEYNKGDESGKKNNVYSEMKRVCDKCGKVEYE